MKTITLDEIIDANQMDTPPVCVSKPSEPVAIDTYLASVQQKPFNASSVQLTELDSSLYNLSYTYRDKKTGKLVEVNKGQPKATIIQGDAPVMGEQAKTTLLEEIVRATILNSETFDAPRCFDFAKMRCDLSYQEVTSYAKAKLAAMASKNVIRIVNDLDQDNIVYSR